MNKNYLKPVFTLMLCLCTLPLLRGQNPNPNPNLDFSYGNFTGWQCYISNSGYSNGNTCYDSLTWTLCPQAVNGRHTIMSDIYDVDPHTCNGDTAGNELLPLVPNGFRYSARIGNSNTGAEAESIRYRLAVDSSNYWVTVHYAAVLEFSNHVDDREARFGVRFQDTAGNLLPVGNVDLSIKDTASMIHCYKVYWKDWDMLGVNLSPWVGQTVEIVIYAADCGLYGHFGYGYAVCECGILKSDVRYCQNDSIAVLSVPEGCRSYRWTDSAGRVLDTVPKIKISIPKTGAVYYCQVGDGQGWRDTLSLQIRKTLITPSILSQRDSLTPFIHLANGSVVTNGELLNQTWRISRRGAGTEYVCNDSAFDYCFKDTGWYEVQLTVDALNRCSDTCSRWFRVEPSPTDVQLLAILNPDADTLWEVRSILPEVRIVNHGNYRVCGGNLVIELCDSTMSVIRSIREEIGIIGAVKSLDVLFSDFLSTRVSGYTTVFSGRYYLKAYMDSFPHDTIHGNDTLLKPLFLNYQKYVNLSVLDCDGFFRPDYDWIPLRELPIKLTRENLFTIRAIIKKYSNYMLDSVHLTAQILDSSFKVVDSQDVWIPAAKQYNCSYSEFYELCWAYDEIGNFVFPDKSVRAPGYTGHFYVKVFFDANPYDTDHANDTIMVRRNCYYKAIMDLEMLSVCPGADSLKGGEKSCPKVMVGNVGDFDAKNVIVEVYVSDSNHVLLSHSTDTFSRLSDTLSWIPVGDTVCRYLSSPYKAPNYTGVYYLKTIVWSMNENGVYADKFRKNDTAECVGHCFYNPAGNATLLSVRPDADSLEGGNLTFPRVVLCNTGRDSVRNIGLEVLVVDKYDTVIAHLMDTIAAIPGGDTAELAFRSRYTVPDYTGSYRLKAVYGTDTIVSVAHCIYRPDTCDISMLSVRPQQDSSFGIVKPVVRYCGYRNRYTYAVNHWDYVYVCLYDSNNVRLGMVNYNDYLNYKDTTVIRFSKGIKVFNYTGRYRLVAYVSYHASKNMIRSNDTVSCTGYCTGDTIDIRMLSVQPSRDSAFGETKVTPVLNTYYRHPDLENSFVDVCVQMYDSSHVLLHQFKNEIFVNCNKTEKEVMSYVDWKVPDYTGVYYLKAFFVNVKKEENLSTANDTAFFKAHCIRHLKKDVALLSVRPQHDSAEVGTWTSPVVVVKNVGDLDVRNVQVKVQVDTCTSSSYMGDMFAYYWDTIPFLAAGDSVKWVLSARYQVPDCWAGSYYRMYASIAVGNDEVSTNNNAFYQAQCSKTVDFRLISFQIPSDTLWGGVPVYPKVRIVNNSIVVTSYFEFRMEVSDSAGNMLQSWQESGTNHVKAGDTMDFQCMKSIQVPNYNGVFRLRAYVSYLPVEYRMTRSDTLVQYYRCFHLDTINVALTNLVYPVTSELLIGRTRVYPTVYVRSRSNVVHHNLAITALVYDNVGALYDSITEIIPKLEAGTSVYRFNRCYKVPNAPGKYKLKVCLESPKGDLSVADNVVQGEFRSRVRPDTIDVALDTLLCPSVTETLLGNTEVRPQVRVVNRGNAEADSLVIDALVYDQSGALADSLMGMIVLLEEGTDTLYTFHSAYKVPNADGTYTLRLHVHAPYGDTCLENNVLQRKLRSRRNDSVNLQLLSVTLSDTGVLAGGAWVHPTVKVANLLRNADANNVKVYVEVLDSAGQMLKLLRDNLARVPMADTVELVFADSLQVPDYTGKFWVRAYVEAAMYETDRSNDTLLCAYTCQSSDAVPTMAMENWQLGQNIPNPAADKTLVPVTLPMPGTVRLQVFAADGRLLYRSEHAVAEGKSLLPLDLAGYASGVYYYSVEYKGERKVRKMVVK